MFKSAYLRSPGILTVFVFLSGIVSVGSGQEPVRDSERGSLTDRPGAIEIPFTEIHPKNRHSEATNAKQTPGHLIPGHHGHVHPLSIYHTGKQEEKVIHITDYLYRQPEIREAYEAYLRMRKESPEELAVMAQTVAYEVGDTRNFFVYNIDESEPGSPVFDEVLFELRAVGSASEIWVEQEELGPGKIGESVVSAMMEALEVRTPPNSVNPDQGIILNNIDIFAQGNPDLVPDPDSTGMVKVLIANIQDGWDPDEGGGFTAGFFNPIDLAPRTLNRNSNQAAILYINSYPGIYTDNQPANPNRPLNTVAHEYQHLIQAGRGNLRMTFLDEGQSEVAEIFNGFNARSMVFLNDPDEVSGNVESRSLEGFLRWRTGEQAVLNDYQRAQLFHSYLYELVGVDAVGRLTQSGPGNPWVQYQNMLNNADSGLDFREVLADFYVTNWVNDPGIADGRYGYTLPQQSGVRATNPAIRYGTEERSWVSNESVSLRYGGAQYTEWRFVQDLSLSVNSPQEIRHYVIAEADGASGPPEIVRLTDDLTFDGMYRSVVLVSVNTVVQSISGPGFGSRQFTYSAEWIPSELREVDISYSVKPTAGFVPIPLEFSSDVTFLGVAVRLDLQYEGLLKEVDFTLWHTTESVEGTGTLQVILTDSRPSSGEGTNAIFVPNEAITFRELDFSELRPGMNTVDFSEDEINLEAGVNYHFYFRIVDASEDAQLLFSFDQGSDDTSDKNYYPVRTLLGGYNPEGELTGWSRLLGKDDNERDNDNKNMIMATRVLSRIPLEGSLPELPVSDRFELLYNYPNPFNSETQVWFNIPDSVTDEVRVRVEVYDILGRRVMTLMDENRLSGKQEVLFDAGNLSSGIYILRMNAGGSADSHKLMLLK